MGMTWDRAVRFAEGLSIQFLSLHLTSCPQMKLLLACERRDLGAIDVAAAVGNSKFGYDTRTGSNSFARGLYTPYGKTNRGKRQSGKLAAFYPSTPNDEFFRASGEVSYLVSIFDFSCKYVRVLSWTPTCLACSVFCVDVQQ